MSTSLNITLTQIKYALAVEKARSFRAAARSCHVTQPTLSMQIQKLEEQLGILLFERASHPIGITPLGSTILSQFRVVLNHTESITELINSAKNTLAGELRLGIIPTLAPYLLPVFLGPFSKNFPEISLSVEELKTTDIVTALAGGTIDLGILVTPLQMSSIREVPIFEEPFYVYAHPDSPFAALKEVHEKALLEETLLLLAEGHCMRDQVTQICRAHQSQLDQHPKQIHFESGSIETLCHLVLKGHGYTVVPHLALPWISQEKAHILPFAEPIPTREVSLVVHQSFVKEALLKALVQSIKKVLPEELQNPTFSKQKIPIHNTKLPK